MYSPARLAAKYLQYYIKASNGRGHGVHSPFVFDFITNVLRDRRSYPCYHLIEALRKELRQNHSTVTIEDFGAGSRTTDSHERQVSAIARSALKSPKFGQLLFRMVQYYQPASILELGTSLGITTAYLASGNPSASVNTLEGAIAIAKIASENFKRLQLDNIKLVEGNFDRTLETVLNQTGSVDFAFVDGNHRQDPTLDYFYRLLPKINDNSILVFDDIHWSREMEAAWTIIRDHPSVTLSLDLFFIGLVFFRPQQKIKQDFVIRF